MIWYWYFILDIYFSHYTTSLSSQSKLEKNSSPVWQYPNGKQEVNENVGGWWTMKPTLRMPCINTLELISSDNLNLLTKLLLPFVHCFFPLIFFLYCFTYKSRCTFLHVFFILYCEIAFPLLDLLSHFPY